MVVLGSGAALFTVLWWRYRGAGSEVELDAIRTAGALTVAVGGAVTLLLAARRQRSTEQMLEHQRLTLEHQREVDRATAEDADKRRITELYARAVDQLGAEKAPVRLGGLHALERLAQDNPDQRQTIVDVICAYLRMPYAPPDDQPPSEDAPQEAHSRYEQRRQELQVRLTAQRILETHLNVNSKDAFWADIRLDLTDAYLHMFLPGSAYIRWAEFSGATFANGAAFVVATFAGDARFYGAKFTSLAEFRGATFTGRAEFTRAEFREYVAFEGATFGGDIDFKGARIASDEFFDEVILPHGWITRPAEPAEGEDEGWLYIVRDQDSREQLTETTDDGKRSDRWRG